MFPILFHWGPVALHTYGALAAAAFLAGAQAARTAARRAGLSPEVVVDGLLLMLVAGILGARLLYVAFHLADYADAPWDALKIWQGGLVWFGGFLLGAPVGAWFFRRKKIPLSAGADIVALAVPLAHAVGRLGCFAAGCCYGRPTRVPWAVTFHSPDSLAPVGIALHPSQIYEAGLNALLFLGLWSLSRRASFRPGAGRLAALYALGYGVIRFVVEMSRGDDRGPLFFSLTSTQIIAIALGLAGGAVLAWTFRPRKS